MTSSLLLPFSHGITVSGVNGIESDVLLSTSYSSYVIPTNATTTVKPEGQENTSHNIGVISESQSTGGAIVWFSSQMFLDESVSSAIGGTNYDYVSSIVSTLCGAKADGNEVSAPLTLVTETLELNAISTALIALIVVGIIPVSIIVIGIVYCVKRRRK